jgi:hypothetical protein
MIVSGFDLDSAFKNYFSKKETPRNTGSVSASIPPRLEVRGSRAACVKSIEFSRQPQ